MMHGETFETPAPAQMVRLSCSGRVAGKPKKRCEAIGSFFPKHHNDCWLSLKNCLVYKMRSSCFETQTRGAGFTGFV
jgi:hypothetical protein